MVDLVAVLQSSLAISGETEFNRLPEALLRGALQVTGAHAGFLFLTRAGVSAPRILEASRERRGIETRACRETASSQDFPRAVLDAVRRQQKKWLPQRADVAADDYLAHRRPKSALCLPLAEDAETTGALYLENTRRVNAFTP